MIRTAALLTVVIVACWSLAATHTTHSGTCPRLTPVANFNVNRFLGLWRVTHGFKVSSTCLAFNYTLKDDVFRVTEAKELSFLDRINVDHKYITVGTLTPKDGNYADTSARFTFNQFPAARYQIFIVDDDYNNAAIFHCQSFIAFHRRNIYVITRGATVDINFLQRVRQVLVVNMMEDSLEEVTHEGCRPQGETELEISPDSIRDSANSFVETAGDVVGTVVGTVVEVGSNIVSSVNDRVFSSDSNSEVELING